MDLLQSITKTCYSVYIYVQTIFYYKDIKWNEEEEVRFNCHKKLDCKQYNSKLSCQEKKS